MDQKFTQLRFSEFAKRATTAAAVGAVALQPAAALAATGSIQVHAGNAVWYLNTNITFSTTSSDWGFSEASLHTSMGTRHDAYDGVLSWHVYNVPINSGMWYQNGYQSPGGVVDILPSPASLTDPAVAKTVDGKPQTFTTGPHPVPGLTVSGQMYFSVTKAVARSILFMQNTTGAAITVNVLNANNLGSDNLTSIQATSSGDSPFNFANDHWWVSCQKIAGSSPAVCDDTADPILTFALSDPTAPAQATQVGAVANGSDTPYWAYNNITIPAGQTRALMVFAQLSDTPAHAEADAPLFNNAASLAGTDYLSGLTPTQLSEIVNWNLTNTLTVTPAGNGSGTVTSSPAGISCGITCSAPFGYGTPVTLTATPAAGSIFTGWNGGGCSGTGTCQVTLTSNTSVIATFAAASTLTVTPSGTGSGTVTSSPSGISCGTTCSAMLATGTPVSLTATAAVGSAFSGWSGGLCNGSTNPCTLTLNSSDTEMPVFTLVPPQVTAVTPAGGLPSGGTNVTITGMNLTGATAVSFGSVPATTFTVNTATQLTAASPAESPGTVDVKVTTPGGTSTANAADHFTFTFGPTVSAVTPKTGVSAGGATVTITGTNFTGATGVKFGGVSATSFTVNSATQITATAPAETAGTVDVTVTNAGGTSPTGAADQFTFGPPPVVTAVSPAHGPTLGGTTVTITGTGLTGATGVNFGGAAAVTFTVNSPTSVTATAPTGAGTVDVTVTTAIGTSPAVAADQFGYEPSHDFNGDAKSDVLWRDNANNIGLWLTNGTSILQSKVLGTLPDSWVVVGQRDFNNDGKGDLLWRDSLGNVGMWLMNGTQIASTAVLGPVPTSWSVAALGDFNADGQGDIVWRDTSGNVGLWLMNGTSILQTATLGNLPTNWVIAGADMKGEIFWRNQTTGEVGIWVVNGTTIAKTVDFGVVPPTWSIAGLGDFDGNGSTDILWRDSSGNVGMWLMNGTQVMSTAVLGNVPLNQSVAQTGDFNGDGKTDILWTDSSGNVGVWFMNGAAIASTFVYGSVPTTWTVQSLNAD